MASDDPLLQPYTLKHLTLSVERHDGFTKPMSIPSGPLSRAART